jgi:cell division protein FtsQ
MTFGMTITPRGRRLTRLGLALILLGGLLAAGWLWLRDSGLVRVRAVTITGVTASDGDQVRAALEQAALGMTTLHVRERTLREATAPYASVAGLRVRADFPRKLTIDVIEQQPVAAIASTGARVPVTGSGVILRGVQADKDLPSVNVTGFTAGSRLTDRHVLRALAIAGAAPPELLHRVDHLSTTAKGVVAELRNGPELVFGSDEQAAFKWTAAARVLAEPSAAGATYLDLRIPGRVAAGGLAPIPQETPDPNPLLEAQTSPTLNP